MAKLIAKIISILLFLAIGCGIYYIKTLPTDLVQAPINYAIKYVEFEDEKITDKETLEAIAEEVVKYQREVIETKDVVNLEAKTEIKILGPASETKPTIILGEEINACYWSKTKGVLMIVNGDMLYQDVKEILENYKENQ